MARIQVGLSRRAGLLLLTAAPAALADLQATAALPEVFALYRSGRPAHPGRHRPPPVHLRWEGDIVRRNRAGFAEAVRRAADTATDTDDDLLVDVREVGFIDIASIGLLIEIAARFRDGRRLIVDAPEHLRLPRLLSIWPDPVSNIALATDPS